MANYVIHVGPHKTGSTYIQRGLYRNHNELRQRGILFPLHWQSSALNPNHAGLLRRLQSGDASLAEEFSSLEQSGFHTLVLSHEGLAGLGSPLLRRFRTMLRADEVKVVYYVRRWTDWLYSAWNEFVVHGSPDSFLEFAMPHLADPGGSLFLNVGKNIQDLVSIFGRDAVNVVSFSSVIENRTDLFEHFCRSFLGQEIAAGSEEARANASHGPAELEILRAMQALDRRGGAATTANVVQRFRSVREQIDISVAGAAGPV